MGETPEQSATTGHVPEQRADEQVPSAEAGGPREQLPDQEAQQRADEHAGHYGDGPAGSPDGGSSAPPGPSDGPQQAPPEDGNSGIPAASPVGTYAPSEPPGGYGPPTYDALPGYYYDPESGLTLPQGVQLASQGRRIGAYFLAIPLAIVTLVIGYIIWGLVIWGRGQTPALQVLGMRCWQPETRRVADWGSMAIREILGRFVIEGMFAIIGVISFIIMLCTRERKAIHDYVGGTVVLHDPGQLLATEQI